MNGKKKFIDAGLGEKLIQTDSEEEFLIDLIAEEDSNVDEVIQPTDSNLVYGNCSACSECNKCTAGEVAVSQGEKMYCWSCFEKFFGLKCFSCMKPMTGWNTMSFVSYKNRVWHRECFRCPSCGQPLKEGQFVQVGESVYCRQCKR